MSLKGAVIFDHRHDDGARSRSWVDGSDIGSVARLGLAGVAPYWPWARVGPFPCRTRTFPG